MSHGEALRLFKIVDGYEKVNRVVGGEEGTPTKTTPSAREVSADAKNLVKQTQVINTFYVSCLRGICF